MKQICMSFHGVISLTRLRRAVELACDELHNQIATCPDVKKYADDIHDLSQELSEMRKLGARIGRKLNVEVPNDLL